jgi:DNA polymerase I-like protein with 3'-5' exonuclease and polymerase domains
MSKFPSLQGYPLIGIDTETNDPNLETMGSGSIRGDGYIVGISLAAGDWKAYFPIAHQGGGNLPKDVVINYLRRELSSDIPKVGANLQYDLGWLDTLGVKVNGLKHDIQIYEALIDENKDGYDLDSLMLQYLKVPKNEEALIRYGLSLGIPEKKIKSNLWKFPADIVRPYAEDDAWGALKVYEQQRPILKELDIEGVAHLESRLIDVLFDMRKRGIPVSYDKAEAAVKQLNIEAVNAQDLLDRTVGWEVDVWSGKELARAFTQMEVDYPLTEKGNPSFTADWLKAQSDPFAEAVSTVRQLDRSANVFIQRKIIDASVNGRLHPNFRQTRVDEGGTRSGRFSSSNPNMQQVPARHPILAPLVRGIFVPDTGYQYGVFDYSQQEPRVTLHYAQLLDLPGAQEAWDQYQANPRIDYHQLVADMALKITGVDIGRKNAKTLNLGMAYGMGKDKLAAQLGMSIEHATKVFNAYHAAVGYVRKLGEYASNRAKLKGFVRTLLGRRRNFPGGQMSHKALNAVVQGSSADMIKQAMVNLYDAGHIIYNTVHDEVNTPIRCERKGDIIVIDTKHAKDIYEILISAVDISVPLVVDFEVGPSWGEAKSWPLE